MTNNLFCKIFGRVQGVGYRAWAKRNAEKLNLTGWVRNCKDSSVEVEICGEKKKRDQFLKECHKGPILSSVKKIDLYDKPYKDYKSFDILF